MLSCTDPAVTPVEADAYALPPQRALDLHRRNRGYPDGQLAWRLEERLRMLCSLRILRSLGVLVDYPPTVHRMGSRSTAQRGRSGSMNLSYCS